MDLAEPVPEHPADLAARTTHPARIASFTAAGFSWLGSGRPITENGAVIGAVAVGGGTPEQDDEVAVAAFARTLTLNARFPRSGLPVRRRP